MQLKTERLLLTSYELDFADDVYNVVKQPQIAATTVNIPHPYPREHVDTWIQYLRYAMDTKQAYEFAVFLKETNRYIGN